MKTPLQFIALDLETTGLDPHTDTIIEIAAIKFSIDFDGEKFQIIDATERTMLVNPGRPLDEEISMITHITDAMLAGKPTWADIQAKVADFIGDNTVILGHNVFFDIAMLATHGIDLTHHKIVDTFELSEILSQDAESLNLGFLADFYSISKRGEEHRALTDTWISADLFVKYLELISGLSDKKQEIFEKFVYGEHSPLYFLKNFSKNHHEKTENLLENFFENQKISQKNVTKNPEKSENPEKNIEIFSLENSDEKKFLEDLTKKFGKLQIVTGNRKTGEIIQKILQNSELSVAIRNEFYQFVAGKEIFKKILEEKNIERKYFIFLVKMLFWLVDTKTGLANELKYYGNEFEWLENFRLQADETNIFLKNQEKNLKNTDIIIEIFNKNFTKNHERKTIFRDILLAENVIRKGISTEISFEKLISNIETLDNPFKNDLINTLRAIEAVYVATPTRPTGENPVPPGKYGETYFFTQNALWHRGCMWLAMANRGLFDVLENFKKNLKTSTRSEKIIAEKIIAEVTEIFAFQSREMPDIGVILTIVNESITVQFITKNIAKYSEKYFKNAIGYGFHLASDGTEKFLENEFAHTDGVEIFGEKNPQIVNFAPLKKTLF